MESLNHSGFRFCVVDGPLAPGYAELYALYDRIFTLPDERESDAGFRKAFSFNTDPELQQRYGAFAELWIAARDEHGALVGGINFDLFHLPEAGCASLHVVYLFTDPLRRGEGIATALLDEAAAEARRRLSERRLPSRPLYLFCEQNAPELMTREAYARDLADAGIDPCRRLIWWHRRGFRRLRMNYVQPPLDEGADPCRTMTLNLRFTKRSIASSIVAAHLRRFFYLSVLKNPSAPSPDAERVLAALTPDHNVPLTGSLAYYRQLARRVAAPDFEPQSQLY